MSFPRYQKYKDSGVEWLTTVPAHWEKTRADAVIREKYESNKGMRSDNLLSLSFGRVVRKDVFSNDGLLPASFDTYQVVEPGDIVFRPTDLQNDWNSLRSAIVEERGIITSAYIAVTTTAAVPRYLHYLFRAYDHIKVFYSMGGGLRQAFKFADLRRLPLLMPPPNEQTVIAAFLDRDTAKIDALMAEQQRLIELLQEKRRAVISLAVTKGLHPKMPMKDSGIEWLGKVPEHWEVGRIKNYFKTCSGGTPNTTQHSQYYAEEGEGHPWVRTTDLNNDLVTSVPVHITDQAIRDTACDILPVGTVMVGMYGGSGTVGKNGLLMIPAAINQAVCGLLPNETHDCGYTFRFIQFYRPYWMIGAESSRKDPNISQEQVKNAPILRPPLEDQRFIVSFLNDRTQAYDRLIVEAERAITLLQERRSALISAAVTGQIDVRGLASSEAA